MSNHHGTLPEEVDFPPVENGIDYLCSVVDHLTRVEPPAPRDLKYAVLHLQAAAEVLLKARLMREHWSLVFKDPGSASRKKFEDGDFNSCTTGNAIDRLRNVANVVVESRESDSLKALAVFRNSLQHFGLSASGPAIEARAADVLDFLMRFAHAEFPQIYDPLEDGGAIDAGLAYVRTKLGIIRSFVKQRYDQLWPDLKDVLDSTAQCTLCTQWAVVLDAGDGPLVCRFCHHAWKSAEYAAADAGLAHSETCGVADCPNCGRTAVLLDLARVASAPGYLHSVCYACGVGFENLRECESCDQYYDPGAEGQSGLCGDCLSARFDRF